METIFYALLDYLIPLASAQGWGEYYSIFGGSAGGGTAFILSVATRAANFFLMLITGGAVLAIMWGGMRMAASGGNEEAKESAKKTVQFALLGAVLALMAQAIIAFTVNFFSVFSNL